MGLVSQLLFTEDPGDFFHTCLNFFGGPSGLLHGPAGGGSTTSTRRSASRSSSSAATDLLCSHPCEASSHHTFRPAAFRPTGFLALPKNSLRRASSFFDVEGAVKDAQKGEPSPPKEMDKDELMKDVDKKKMTDDMLAPSEKYGGPGADELGPAFGAGGGGQKVKDGSISVDPGQPSFKKCKNLYRSIRDPQSGRIMKRCDFHMVIYDTKYRCEGTHCRPLPQDCYDPIPEANTGAVEIRPFDANGSYLDAAKLEEPWDPKFKDPR